MAGKANGVEFEWARAPPPSLPFCTRLARFCYDPTEKSVLGRTPKRWAIAITFYLVFYAVLAALTAICFAGLMRALDPHTPLYTLNESLIGSNPGVAFRPRDETKPDYNNLRYSNNNGSHYEKYLQQVQTFLKSYENETWFKAQKACTAADNYGLPNTPCFYIKLNKIFNWAPEYFDGDKRAFPADMPEDLKTHIMGLEPVMRSQIWVSCQEEKANGTGIEYPWTRGLPAAFYPYRNERGYRSPLVAVRLTPPFNEEVTIRCRAWANNIIYNKSLKEPRGYTRIQLQIDDAFSKSAA